jgi:hypothetical protein
MTELPPEVAQLADAIAALPGAIAVVLGRSRARVSLEPGRDRGKTRLI